MPRELLQSPSASPIDRPQHGADMSADEAYDDDHNWSLPWPVSPAHADDQPSRPPKIWGAEPNLGRIWPVQTRAGGSAVH